MRKLAIAVLLLLAAATAGAQALSDTGANSRRAQAELRSSLDALGGAQYLALGNYFAAGRIAGFYHGAPTGAIENYREWRNQAGDLRVEFGKKHDDVNIYTGDDCWEATYQGKRRLPAKDCTGYLRRRAHSLDVIFRTWMNDPKTLFIDDGQTLSGTHLTDQITLFNAQNDSVTIQIDASTRLPRSISYQWRNPLYRDKDTERIQFDNYHVVEEVPTPFRITLYHNGDVVSQRYLDKAGYNVPLPPDAFDVDATVARITKR